MPQVRPANNLPNIDNNMFTGQIQTGKMAPKYSIKG
jgi:hypothetical protein